jgi:hypothetical protein
MQKGLDSIDIEVNGANTYVKADDVSAIRQAKADAEEIKGLIEAELFGAEMKAWGKSPSSSSVAMQAAAMGASKVEAKTLGELFTDSEEFKHFRQTKRLTMDEPWTIEAKDITRLGTYEQKNVYAGGANGDTITRTLGSIQFDPMVPRGYRPVRVRDLFPAATTSSNLIDFFRVVGFAETSHGTTYGGAASVVADYSEAAFGVKPHSNLTFNNEQAPVRTIAHWEAAHRNVLDDVPQLQSTINNELMYGLALEEDWQILQGTGTGEDLTGLLTRNDTQTYTAASATELKSDSLRKAATKAVIANYAPTGYVLHPNDWEDVELQKGTGDGQYMLITNIAVGLAAQVWRQPVVETVAMPEGTFLTGAFGIGAQLYDRQVANIRIAEQHSDFFVRNAVVILAEQRLALATKRPESFVKGTFGVSS